MFVSFFPKPRLLLLSAIVWSLLCILGWYFLVRGLGPYLSLGSLVGYGYPAPLGSEADAAAQAAHAAATEAAAGFFFYQYFVVVLGLFIGAWMVLAPHPWQNWSVLGSGLILFTNWIMVQLDVLINEWFGSFFDLVQNAMTTPNSVPAAAYYAQMWTFLTIALSYVVIGTLFRFFVSHFIFRWRTAMNDYYTHYWPRLRHIEGASQRVQEDTMRFATITEGLGISLVDALMTLIAFLPILWVLSAQVTELPVVGAVPQGLVFVAIIWSIVGTGLLALAGIKLPGLEFRNQRVEAAYRKELVYGEDDESRAQPVTLRTLFADIRRNYFRLYLHYMYFNLARILYLQAGVLVPYIALAPTILSGAITLGVMQQIVRAFDRVQSSFQYLVNSWTTIVELLSVHKRLKAFEATIRGEPLPDIDRRYLERQAAQEAEGQA